MIKTKVKVKVNVNNKPKGMNLEDQNIQEMPQVPGAPGAPTSVALPTLPLIPSIPIRNQSSLVNASLPIKSAKGRPKKQPEDTSKTKNITTFSSTSNLPTCRVFSLDLDSNLCGKTNNIIRLKIQYNDIHRLENQIARPMELVSDEHEQSLDKLFDSPFDPKKEVMEEILSLDHFVKKKSVFSTEEKQPANRKDLIINSGIRRISSEPLQVFSDNWPLTSPYACWYCCHTFDNTPVGIPSRLVNYVFVCYGNFCSYNCAKRYLCPQKDDEDDVACMQATNDIFKGDDHGEKLQLLELLYHLETNAELDEPIKASPRRLVLKMFGGNKTIEEYRKSFKTNTTFHTFKMPLVSMAYHMEECTDTKNDVKRKLKNMSLDVAKLERAYEDMLKEKERTPKMVIEKTLYK
jgi:hypothetical protein